jgi:hypothetical protein
VSGGDTSPPGLQRGGIFKLGKARLDATMQLDFDAPGGGSVSDEASSA